MVEILDKDNLKIKGLFLNVAIMLSILFFSSESHLATKEDHFQILQKFKYIF